MSQFTKSLLVISATLIFSLPTFAAVTSQGESSSSLKPVDVTPQTKTPYVEVTIGTDKCIQTPRQDWWAFKLKTNQICPAEYPVMQGYQQTIFIGGLGTSGGSNYATCCKVKQKWVPSSSQK